MLQCQLKYDYNWIWANNWSSEPGIECTMLSFNNKAEVTKFSSILQMFSANVTMSNSEGNLGFYSNGCVIVNANHHIMKNGDGINAGEEADISCFGAAPHYDGNMIAIPLTKEKFAMFQGFLDNGGTITKLKYSIVSLNSNPELSEVLEKNNWLIKDSLNYNAITAIKHQNGIDWWLLKGGYYKNNYYTAYIENDSIYSPVKRTIPNIPHERRHNGYTAVSPDGETVVFFDSQPEPNDLEIYDFNRETGELTLTEVFDVCCDSTGYGGVAISANNRYLYVVSPLFIKQYDLWASNIKGTEHLVADADYFKQTFVGVAFADAQLGPDCRIYINSPGSSYYITVIMEPDLPGPACDVRPHYLSLLGNFHGGTLPHFPFYRLGTGYSVCDPSIVLTGVYNKYKNTEDVFHVWPQVVRDRFYYNMTKEIIGTSLLTIIDLSGKVLQQQKIQSTSGEVELKLSEFSQGMYVVCLRTQKGEVYHNRMIIQ